MVKENLFKIDYKIYSLEEWSEVEIHTFTQALEKYHHDWTRIAECVHRSEESCRAFYLKRQRKNVSPSDDHVKTFYFEVFQLIFILI
jgi:protein associated with RNAse G/E